MEKHACEAPAAGAAPAGELPAGLQGLSDGEAARLAQEGKSNVQPPSREDGVLQILRRNVFTLFNLLNVILAALLISVGSYRNMLFLGVVLSNLCIGTVQELRAKRTHDRLQLLAEAKVRTLRGQSLRLLAPHELVEGDVVELRRGEQIPADALVLQGQALADESILTGESAPVAKAQGDTLYSGSFLKQGQVWARLTAVGVESYMGRLQMSARKVKRAESVLMGDMKRIIRYVSIAIVPLGLLLYLKQRGLLHMEHPEALVKTVASVLGMIPEGLVLLTSISLAAGVVKLGRRKTLVNELYGIESLARTDVVCMDKTGTLTGGEMQLRMAVPFEGVRQEELEQSVNALLTALGSDGQTALALRAAYPEAPAPRPLQTVPFSSERKWSLARFETLGTLVMGAPERLLEGGLLAKAQEYAAQGLRVVALARSPEKPGMAGEDAQLPTGLIPMGLLCLNDALRPQVAETVRYLEQQGVTLKVLSGDSPLTVSRVALDAGIENADRLIDLSALEGEKDYAALSRQYTVFGRVSPEDKRELVCAMQREGRSVAMVGDGVNDIPALKAANCSIALPGGSDAACRVAQMTLLSGGFDAVPQIVLEGRRVINNITRASSLFLVKNIYSMLLSLLLLALPFGYPFMPIQMTLVSSLTVGFPSFVLALEPSRERVSGNFIRNIIMRALPGGVSVAVAAICVMLLKKPLGYDGAAVSTLCTLLAAFSGLVTLLLTCLPLNRLRAGLVLLVTGLMTLAVLCFPSVFYLTALQGSQLWVLAGLGALVIPMQLALGALVRRRPEPRGAQARG